MNYESVPHISIAKGLDQADQEIPTVSFKDFSPVSILVGAVLAVVSVAFLWPVGDYGTRIVLIAFCAGAGGYEIVRRIVGYKSPPVANSDAPPRQDEP